MNCFGSLLGIQKPACLWPLFNVVASERLAQIPRLAPSAWDLCIGSGTGQVSPDPSRQAPSPHLWQIPHWLETDGRGFRTNHSHLHIPTAITVKRRFGERRVGTVGSRSWNEGKLLNPEIILSSELILESRGQTIISSGSGCRDCPGYALLFNGENPTLVPNHSTSFPGAK
jgi:hypothetical protein